MAGIAPQIPGCRDLSLIGERVARSLFSATSDRLGRPVTVIAYPPLSEGRTEADFDRAATTAQRLGVHPSMISIHEWGHAGDHRPWIITDPQPADALDTLLSQDGPLEIERALQMGVLLAGALETAHAAGIVHGDLSPARVVVGPHGEPLMTETGLARFAVFPGLGALNNPVRYHASPEVLEGTELTPATDVYSLATTIYALIAGRAPQEKPAEITDSNASLLLRVLQMAPPPIERSGLPPGLLEALRGPLAPDPRKRPQQAIEVAWLLQDVQRRAGFPITEPVVLDLDDIEHHRSRRAGSYPAPAPAPPRQPVAEPAPAADPWGTWSGPIDVEGPPAPALPAPSARAPMWSPPPIPDRPAAAEPPATVVPLAAGGDDDADAPAAPKDTLWPSSWPAGQPDADLPAWARQPAGPPANGNAPGTPDATDREPPADPPPWAKPSPEPGTPTQDPAPDLPPWAKPGPEPSTPTQDPAADLPPWAKPGPEASTPSQDRAADLPPWAKPSTPTQDPAAELSPWAQPTGPSTTSDDRPGEPRTSSRDPAADLPPWAKPSAESGAPTQDQAADLPPWAKPGPEPSAPTQDQAPDLPPWANPGPEPSTPTQAGTADAPPWAQPNAEPSTPTQDGTADAPPWAQPSPEPSTPTQDRAADSPPWAQPSPEPSTPTQDRAAEVPPWAQLSAEPSTPTQGGTADAPPWAQPSAESGTPTQDRAAEVPPWARPGPEPSRSSQDQAAHLLPWERPEPGSPTQDQAADVPPWAKPSAEPSTAAQEPAADLLPWEKPSPESSRPSQDQAADLPSWAKPSLKPATPTPGATADSQPSGPRTPPPATAGRPPLPQRSPGAEMPAGTERPALPKRQSVGEGERPAWAQSLPAPRWAQGGSPEPEEKQPDESQPLALPGWARARPGGGEGNGTDEGDPPWIPGAETSSSFAVARPPELDILPAWYTDPLPLGGNGSSNGHAGAGAGTRGGERLPGAGDELRSLFGAVVGEPPPPPPLPPEPEAFLHDRPPPLDFSKLVDPVRPAAPLPLPPPPPAAKAPPLPSPAPVAKAPRVRAAGGVEKPLRLPRPPLEPEAPPAPGGSRGHQAYPPPDTTQSGRTATGPMRDQHGEPRGPAAPTSGAQAGAQAGAAPPAGPAALPVIVLVVVLAVLVLGIVWLLITGDDSGPPADEPPDAAALAPTGLTVTPGPEGDQLVWQGDGEAYIVTVLSPTEPPQALPAAAGTSALVPNTGTAAPGQRCYTVAVAPSDAQVTPGPASEPVCPPGVSPASMLPAP